MKSMQLNIDPSVESVFAKYPDPVRKKLMELRALILETAEETDTVSSLEETLKWGEPSYVTKHGSTIRMDWKAKSSDQYALYFQCSSRLVDTFRVVFATTFRFEGKRALIFPLDGTLPVKELKACIRAALEYHKVKQLPTLGI